jgi:serine/threonine-protein kinase HipA
VNYLWNLLPDSTEVLERWARRFSVSPRNPVRLLAHVGLDAVGAVQLVNSDVHDEPALPSGGGFTPMTDADIAAHLRELRADPAAWVTTQQDEGYFSLAGAQGKFTLLRTPDGWATPSGTTASTHIIKPGVTGLARSDLNEHLTMRAAALLGLHVAQSRVAQFEDQTAIVVTRFDRVPGDDGTVQRLHQEDFAQAAGVHPSAKYQNEGGPGIATIAELMWQHLGRGAGRDIPRFFEATLFNWASLSTDAHAKNYAIRYGLRRTSRPELAPLYDLGSALPFPEISDRRAKLAMSFDGHYRVRDIEPRHIMREAEGIGLDADWARARARELVVGLPEAFSTAVAEMPLERDGAAFARRLIDAAAQRSTALLTQLDRQS